MPISILQILDCDFFFLCCILGNAYKKIGVHTLAHKAFWVVVLRFTFVQISSDFSKFFIKYPTYSKTFTKLFRYYPNFLTCFKTISKNYPKFETFSRNFYTYFIFPAPFSKISVSLRHSARVFTSERWARERMQEIRRHCLCRIYFSSIASTIIQYGYLIHVFATRIHKACFTLQLRVAYISLAIHNVLCFEMDYTLQLRCVTN